MSRGGRGGGRKDIQRPTLEKLSCHSAGQSGAGLAYLICVMSEMTRTSLAAPPLRLTPVLNPNDQTTPTPAVPLIRTTALVWLAALALFAFGAFVRIYPTAGFTGVGFDEHLYQRYVVLLNAKGLGAYPAFCEYFIVTQNQPGSICELPPTRFLYILCGSVWSQLFGSGGLDQPGPGANVAALAALKAVACLFSILTLIPSALLARRLKGDGAMLGTLALMTVAPVQVHLAQHRMIDGFFAFWALTALWLLWENLRAPNRAGWLAALTVCLAAMVMTKENAFFVYLALGGLIALNRWTKWGTVTPKLLLCMIAGPLVGLTTLIVLAGGTENFITIYKLLVSKAQNLEYAIRTGDGPWYRYFVDYMLVSPLVLILAIGAVFSTLRKSRPLLYVTAFIAGSYVLMCNVKYGMNLRYTTIWDMPLRLLAYAQLAQLTLRCGPRQPLVLGALITGVCAYEWRQYYILFHDHALYELVVGGLLYALKMLKGATPIIQ